MLCDIFFERGCVMADDYSMSYTAAGLMYPESLAVAEAYVKTYDWEKTWGQIRTENLMQKRCQTSIERQRRELVKRLIYKASSHLKADNT